MRILPVLSTLCLLALSGMAHPSFADSKSETAPGLEEAFDGRALGRGRFRSALIGLDRGFLVATSGRKSGKDFVLDQVFRFDDGMTDRRTWHFRRTGPRTYVGTRQDVVGEAKVLVEDDAIIMSYDIDMPQKSGGKVRLHFEDKVRRDLGGTILNRAVVYALGMPVGSVVTTLVPQ